MPEWTIDEIVLDLILVETNHPEIHNSGKDAIMQAIAYLERVKRLEDRLEREIHILETDGMLSEAGEVSLEDMRGIANYLKTGEEW